LVSGEIATSLLGAQEGGEASFASLYELTNPALVRYLRVVSDADPTNLALTTWTTLLRRLPTSAADENAWLELVVGAARLTVEDARQRESWSHLVDPTDHLPPMALADLEVAGAADGPAADSTVAVGAPGPAQGIGAAPAATAPDEVPDRVDSTIAALRACPPDEADLLAMRATAWLNREAICRLTGRDAASVRTGLDQALEHVGLPLFTLVKALRAPARPDELADLPVVLHLFANEPAQRRVAAVGTVAASAAAVGAVGQPSALNLLDVPAAHASSAAGHSAGTTAGAASHLGWVGATAAAAAIAVGGVGAAWNGLLPDLFGGHGHQGAPSAAGPARTGPPAGGDAGQPEPPTTGRQPVTPPQPPAVTKPEPGAGQTATGAQGTVSLGRVQLAVQVVSVPGNAPGPGAVVTDTPPAGPPKGPATPPPTQEPSTPVSQPPVSPPRTTPSTHGHGKATGHTKTHPAKATGHAKTHGQGKAKGHAKTHGQGKAKGHTKDKAKGHAYGHAKHTAASGGGKRTAQR
jgi:hypothetical protein